MWLKLFYADIDTIDDLIQKHSPTQERTATIGHMPTRWHHHSCYLNHEMAGYEFQNLQ